MLCDDKKLILLTITKTCMLTKSTPHQSNIINNTLGKINYTILLSDTFIIYKPYPNTSDMTDFSRY